MSQIVAQMALNIYRYTFKDYMSSHCFINHTWHVLIFALKACPLYLTPKSENHRKSIKLSSVNSQQ